ncbi:MAG: hypothetical protein EZS28_037856 [Streblomastix strix]|uniref:Uncharacterized protein n=1 Tax=Streblomastix strix TaxID=222440 RepID=A0A5J4U7R7_9EUKA|nr:MAG: hypothetical protein EZS28_037856 [Streblomastix strix]
MAKSTDAAPRECGSTLENELKMTAIVHRTWNQRQAKLTINNREIKAIFQGHRSFAKILKNSRVQSLAIRSDNSTTVFDIRKWREQILLIRKIKHILQTIEKLGIQIQITHLSGIKNEIIVTLSGLSKAGECKLKKKIFQQIQLLMNLNLTIDLSS